MENIHYDVMMNFAAPNVTSVVNFITVEVVNPDRIFSHEFQNLVFLLVQVMKEKDQTYNSAITEINDLLASIDEELAKD